MWPKFFTSICDNIDALRNNELPILCNAESWTTSVLFTNVADSQQGADHDASTPAARVRNNRDDDMPEPRQHAYLPGASHPLYPEQWIGRSGVSRYTSRQHGSISVYKFS